LRRWLVDALFARRNAEFAGAGSRQTAVLNPSFGWGAYTREAFFEKLPDASFSNGWNEKTGLAGAYAQAHVRAGKQLHLLLGGRGEAHRYNTGYYDLISGAGTYSDSLTALQWIPRAGFLYAPQGISHCITVIPADFSRNGVPTPFPADLSRPKGAVSTKLV
jgi:hypothetical protein